MGTAQPPARAARNLGHRTRESRGENIFRGRRRRFRSPMKRGDWDFRRKFVIRRRVFRVIRVGAAVVNGVPAVSRGRARLHLDR